MDNWLTIESAPKDGTRVLLWDAGGRQALIGRWSHSQRLDNGRVTYEKAEWSAVGLMLFGDDFKPTHWMLLPLGPKV